MTKLSVVIPAYEMAGLGTDFLAECLDSLKTQSFKNFEVVISDSSPAGTLRATALSFSSSLEVRYFHSPASTGNPSMNLNNAIRKSSGDIIKVLFQDDFLFDEKSLQRVVTGLRKKKFFWLVTGSTHTRDRVKFFNRIYPRYVRDIHLGNNTISSPSVLAFRNHNPPLFDEELLWLMDVDYYRRLFDLHGRPKVVRAICSVNRVGTHQVSNTLATSARRASEGVYIKTKYPLG